MIVTQVPSYLITVLAVVGVFKLFFPDLINRTFGNHTHSNFSHYSLLALMLFTVITAAILLCYLKYIDFSRQYFNILHSYRHLSSFPLGSRTYQNVYCFVSVF